MNNPYVNYYTNQAGKGVTSHTDVRYQRGNGFLGRWFGKALTKLLPVLKYAGKKGLKTAVDVGADVLAGETLKKSASKRIKETVKEVIDDSVKKADEYLQEGSGKRKSKSNRKTKLKSKKKKVDFL